MTFFALKMIIFGHFSRFLAFFKLSFSSLQHPNYEPDFNSQTTTEQKVAKFENIFEKTGFLQNLIVSDNHLTCSHTGTAASHGAYTTVITAATNSMFPFTAHY